MQSRGKAGILDAASQFDHGFQTCHVGPEGVICADVRLFTDGQHPSHMLPQATNLKRYQTSHRTNDPVARNRLRAVETRVDYFDGVRSERQRIRRILDPPREGIHSGVVGENSVKESWVCHGEAEIRPSYADHQPRNLFPRVDWRRISSVSGSEFARFTNETDRLTRETNA